MFKVFLTYKSFQLIIINNFIRTCEFPHLKDLNFEKLLKIKKFIKFKNF